MVTMNIGGLRGAEGGAAEREGLAKMKATFAEVASDPAMFGNAPNADRAAAALRRAAQSMLDELERAGHSVEDIRQSAAAAAGIGEDSDAEAKRTLTRAQASGVTAFDGRMPGTGGG
jgi:hypothetical protein